MIDPEEYQKKRETWVREMRKLCDLMEARPDIPVPYGTVSLSCFLHEITGDEKAALASLAREFSPCAKTHGSFHVGLKIINNSAFTLHIHARRETVCKRKVTTTIVPEKIYPASKELVIPAHEETKEEWECEPILGGKEVQA